MERLDAGESRDATGDGGLALNDVAVIVRLYYWPPYPEAARRWRFAWFRDHVLPLLLAQTVDFDLWIWVNPAHRAEVEAMSPRIRTFTVDTTHELEQRIPWRKVRELPQYPIQFRVDSDDLVSPDYIATGIAALNTVRRPLRALAWFQPYKVDLASGDVYWCAPRNGTPYGPRYPSAFAALRQPVVDYRYDWVYGYGHTQLWRAAERVVGIPVGKCWAACHTFNDSTGLWPGDVALVDASVPTGLIH